MMKLTLTIILLLLPMATVAAQAPNSTVEAQTIATTELLKFRGLQYENAKRIVQLQELKASFEKLQTEQQAIVQQMADWITAQAKAQNVDLKTHYFDFEELKFMERPKPEAPK